jgi:hypothetical protein
MLSVERGLHGYDRWDFHRAGHDDDEYYADIWSDDHDDRRLQFSDRSVWGRVDGAKHILSIRLHTHVLRERCYLFIILHLLSGGIDVVLCVSGWYQRGDGVWSSGWDYGDGDVCTSGSNSEQHMQLAQ